MLFWKNVSPITKADDSLSLEKSVCFLFVNTLGMGVWVLGAAFSYPFLRMEFKREGIFHEWTSSSYQGS